MKKKGLFSIALATVMIVGGLTGCGAEKVTAESLVKNAFGTEEVKSLDADVSLNLDMDVDASSLFGSDTDADTTMNFAIDLDCNVQSTKDVAHTEGKATVSFFGTKTKVNVENYSDIENEVAYNYDEDSDTWTKSDLDSSSFDFSSVTNELNVELFDNLTLAEQKSKDDNYTVTGTITYKKLEKLLGDELDSLTENMDDDTLDLSKLSFDVTMTFAKDTKLIKTMSYTVNPEAFDSDDCTINKMEISIKVNNFNKVNDLEVPKDVKENAVEEDSSFGGFEDDLDSSFGVDSTETTTDSQSTQTTQSTETSDDSTLAQIYLNKDYAYQDDLEALMINYYPNIKNFDSGAMVSLMTFFNNYTSDEFANYLDVYEYWSESDKIALALLYDSGVIDDETLNTFSISSVEVQSYVTKYIDPLK